MVSAVQKINYQIKSSCTKIASVKSRKSIVLKMNDKNTKVLLDILEDNENSTYLTIVAI